MRVLVVANMYPTPANPASGIFVKEQVESLQAAGIEVDVVAFDGKGGLGRYPVAVRRLHQALRQKPYDLLHAHYGLSGVIARMQVRYPIVTTFHGSDLSVELDFHDRRRPESIAGTTLSKLAALGAARCIVVADILKPKLWLKSAITIPMGVDLELFQPIPQHEAQERLRWSPDKRRVVFVANPLNPIKRFDIARDAVQLLQRDDPALELIPVTGISHQQVPLYMNAADVLVLTSRQEASPCVIKEALACNLPIVSTDVGDVALQIAGVEGCYLCERTPQDVAAKLRGALQYGRCTQGRDKVRDLSLDKIAQRVIAVYREVSGAHS